MQYTYLGKTNIKISRLCLGMMSFGSSSWRKWILNEDEAIPLIHRAIRLGCNFFDTANVYSHGISEEITGKALKKFCKREDIVIATKAFYPVQNAEAGGLSRKSLFSAVDHSLRRLQVDYIDLYQIHRFDYATPLEETLLALHDLITTGKIRHIGASSMYAWQFSKAQYLAKINGWTPFISMQNHYNLVYREEEREMIPLCQDMNVAILPWSPLARGFLSDHRTKDKKTTLRAQSDVKADEMYFQQEDFAVREDVIKIAKKKQKTLSQIALAWLLNKQAITSVIIGITKEAHLHEAVHAMDISLTDQEVSFLERSYKPHPVITFDMDKQK